ncbi:MAG: trypsin-like peptidase domain-containing protein [Peptococcaceae bacterium]|nr:trypsin-like peptidase domain-containing protein [Peptococcaceae bacterium]
MNDHKDERYDMGSFLEEGDPQKETKKPAGPPGESDVELTLPSWSNCQLNPTESHIREETLVSGVHSTHYAANGPFVPNISDVPDISDVSNGPYMMAPAEPKMPKKGSSGGLVVVCIILSLVCGFGGAYIADYLKRNSTLPLIGGSTGSTVLYQSVVRTDDGDVLADKMSMEDVVATVKSSVVEITTETVSRNGRMGQFISTGAGSGVIVSTDGYIVTNNHVVSDANSISVRLSDEQQCEAILIGTDAKTDLAIIKIDAKDLQPAVLGNSATLLVGQTAVAIGNPLGELGGTVTSGIISALGREITMDGETMALLQTDTAINPGNSGGGLFDLNGDLVGVVNAKSSGSGIEGLGFAIPIDTAKPVIEQIIAHGYVKGRIDTGLTLVDIQDMQTAMSYRTNQMGLYISNSISNNFQSGDRIIAVEDQAVSSLAEFKQVISVHGVGDRINITVVRNGRNVTELLTLIELKS